MSSARGSLYVRRLRSLLRHRRIWYREFTPLGPPRVRITDDLLTRITEAGDRRITEHLGYLPEPPGSPEAWELAFERDFSTTALAPWFDGNDAPGSTWTTDGTDCTTTIPTGMDTGVAPHGCSRGIPSAKRGFRFEFRFQLAENFEGNSTGFNKLGFQYPSGLPKCFADLHGADNGPYALQVSIQGTVSHGGGTNFSPNIVPGAQIEQGDIVTIRHDVLHNTNGNADGRTRLWVSTDDVNFTLVLDEGNIQFTEAGGDVSDMALDVTWGGSGDPASRDSSIKYINVRGYTIDSF